jgi:hypothetical protein
MEKQLRQALRSVTTIYLLIPALLFGLYWLRFPFSLISTLLVAVIILSAALDLKQAIVDFQQGTKLDSLNQRKDRFFTIICLAVLLITLWLLFSGVGGFGHQNADYKASNALFKDLITQGWPPTLFAGDSQKPIVYYVAYYLPAAAVGKLLGWVPANLVLFIWTLIGSMLAFSWFWRHSRISIKGKTSRIIGLVIVFCLAGGLDYFGYYILKEKVFDLANHIDVWAGYFQYSSNTTLMFWVPQQAIAGWLLISMIIDNIKTIQDVRYLWAVASACIIWSPFSVLGSFPYLFLALLTYLNPENRKFLLNRPALLSIFASLWIGITHSLYILSNQFKFPAGLMLSMVENDLRYIQHLIAFWFVEYGLVAFIVLLFLALGTRIPRSQLVNKSDSLREKWFGALEQEYNLKPIHFYLFLLSVVILTILPLFTMGNNNDLVMRASIPSLFIFWTFVFKILIDAPLRTRIKLSVLYIFLSTILVLGFFSSVSELFRSVKKFHIGPPEISEVLVTSELGDRDIDQRSGSADSFFFRYMGK